MSKGPAIILMSKVPLAGYTKTRLMDRLSGRECAEFHSACLFDLAQTVEEVGCPTYLYYTGGDPGEFPIGKAISKLIKRPQIGRDLGERMYNAALEAFSHHDRLIFIGSDLPNLSSNALNLAFTQLVLKDTVVGPAEDGGYYLLGLKQAHVELFSGIEWGAARVMTATLAKIKVLGLSTTLLETLRDIDTWDDIISFSELVLRAKQYRDLQSYRFIKQILNQSKESILQGGRNNES
jgi:rSAM/selenodomain-associated transferase 1